MVVVIADAGPLIAFAKIDQLDILQKLFSQVLMTESVKAEILVANSAERELIRDAIKEGWLGYVENPELQIISSRSLGMGEKTSIEYALHSPEDVLLILDDALARKKALRYQLNIVGTAMLLYTAEKKQLIVSAEALKQKGYRISKKIIA